MQFCINLLIALQKLTETDLPVSLCTLFTFGVLTRKGVLVSAKFSTNEQEMMPKPTLEDKK